MKNYNLQSEIEALIRVRKAHEVSLTLQSVVFVVLGVAATKYMPEAIPMLLACSVATVLPTAARASFCAKRIVRKEAKLRNFYEY